MLDVREVVMKALEEARGAKTINKSQEASIEISAPRSVLDAVEQFAPEVFEELFIVSEVAFVEGDELGVRIGQARGEKCPRCWNYRELGGNPNHPSVCMRCGDALDAIGYKE